jgi:hypothetical protein
VIGNSRFESSRTTFSQTKPFSKQVEGLLCLNSPFRASS